MRLNTLWGLCVFVLQAVMESISAFGSREAANRDKGADTIKYQWMGGVFDCERTVSSPWKAVFVLHRFMFFVLGEFW